ncbi:MAG: hypothetical protein AB1483_06000 [Candidatus Zixiibacteriota bacterium]
MNLLALMMAVSDYSRLFIRSRNLFWPAAVLAITVVGSSVRADDYMTDEKQQFLISAQSHLLNDRFDSAQKTLDSLVGMDSADPIGYLFKAAVYLARMTDAEEELDSDEFRRLADTSISLAEIRLVDASGRQAAWMYLWLGHAKAYRSLWESRFGSFTSALKLALNARSDYEKGFESDSTLYDLYGGLGMYHYWKSAKAGILRWLQIFKNDREKGVDELYLAVDSSIISRHPARNALIWIWLDMDKYDSVVTICEEMLGQFPDGKLFLWPLAEALYEKKNYDGAIEVYLRLRGKLAVSPGNYYNLVECDYNLNRCFDRLDREKDAIEAARRVEDYYDLIPDKTKRRQRSKLDFLRRFARRVP